MQRRPLLMLAGLWPLGAAAVNARLPPLPLVYPRHQALNDPQQGYVTALLQMALARSGQAYALRRSELRMVQTRAMQEIATASGSVDVVWAMTSRERETQLLPVRIPIDRGLIRQLAAGRIDYFPRSVIEAQSELASHAPLLLALSNPQEIIVNL